MKAPSLTIGVEEEYQIVNPETRDLESYISRLLAQDHPLLHQCKPELHQAIVEVATTVVNTPQEAREQLIALRRTLLELTAKDGLAIAAAGSHPFANWQDKRITQLQHYLGVRDDMGDLAQRLLIFGTHVHVAIEDRDFMIDAMNVARYFLPHLLCLSTSSPFWIGRKTGLKSYRSAVFRGFPRTGIPNVVPSWYDFENYVDTLMKTNCVASASKIWWDVRPSAKYPTLELRICDVCTRVDETICIAAIWQAILLKIYKMRRDNTTFRVYPQMLIEENKWRAMRFGLSGNLIDLGKQQEAPAGELIRELVTWFVDDVVDDLGSRKEVEYALKIIEGGSSADRQLATYERTGDLNAVVDQLIAETAEGVVQTKLRPTPVRPMQAVLSGSVEP